MDSSYLLLLTSVVWGGVALILGLRSIGAKATNKQLEELGGAVATLKSDVSFNQGHLKICEANLEKVHNRVIKLEVPPAARRNVF